MLYSVSGRGEPVGNTPGEFTIGGITYKTDEEGHAIDKLFYDRIELIKKYLRQDPLYDEDFCNYIKLAKGTFGTYYWGVNHFTAPPSITYIVGETYQQCLKNGSNKETGFHDLRARPFLAF